jgi:hypothetical protein
MQVVKYNDIEYNIPFDVNLTLDSKDKLIDVANPFSGATASLPWFAVAVYDLIMGAQQLEDYKTVQDGCDWFAKHFPKEYMTLLD